MWIFLFNLAVLTLGQRPARAHVAPSPTVNNRYLKISLTGGGAVRIAYTVLVGEAPATAARRKADLDGNGTLDAGEVKAWARSVADATATGLHVTVDGTARALAWEAPIPGVDDPRVGPIPFSIDLVGTLSAAGAGPHVVTLDDETPLDQLGETEIRIEEGPGTRVLSAWRGRDDGSRSLRFLFNGPKYSVLEDRTIGFRFVDEAVAHRRRRSLPIALVGSALGAIVATVLLRRARRRTSPGR